MFEIEVIKYPKCFTMVIACPNQKTGNKDGTGVDLHPCSFKACALSVRARYL